MRDEDQILLNHLGAENPAHAQFARGFSWKRVSVEGRDWAAAKVRTERGRWTPQQQAEFLACLPPDAETWDLVDSLGADVGHAYWQRVPPFGIGEADSERASRNLLRHGRSCTAVSLLARHFAVPPSLAADALEALLKTPHDEARASASLSYDLGKLVDRLQQSPEFDRSRVARIEWAFLPLLRHDHEPRVLHEKLARDPAFFTEVVSSVFRAEGERPAESSQEHQARARRAYELLTSWRTLPGDRGDGSVDSEVFGAWVDGARQLLDASDRGGVGDEMIGQLLSGSPTGPDGVWPHPTVRDAIERMKSTDLDRGIEIGLFNSRGVVWRNLNDGGIQERQIADRYDRDAAAVADRWPRTAAMLRRMAATYRAHATAEDGEAELRQDLES